MQMLKKQAYIVEVRKKSRHREKAFLNNVQNALNEIRVSHPILYTLPAAEVISRVSLSEFMEFKS